MSRYCSAIGKTIRARRRTIGLTLPALAQRAGISKGNLSKIENKPSDIGILTLRKIANALGVSLAWLLTTTPK